MSQNLINASGIQIEQYADILNDIINGTPQVPGLISIYGPDINVASNSPDGEWIASLALSKLNMEQFGLGIYQSFDPDQAVGTQLDALSMLNGLTRKAGTYTQTQIVITTDQSATLSGLDNIGQTPFTVADSNGNQYNLITTVVIGPGVNTLNFQAANIGFVQAIQNTITVITTPQLGVLAVNNPYPAYSVGAVQETDSQFRLRRQQSTAGISTHKAQALYAALNELPGVEQAVVYENSSATTDVHNVPPHSIWPILVGGTAYAIAETIYDYLGDGCGNKGSNSYDITQIDGSEFRVYYDQAIQEQLYIHLNIESLIGGYIDNAAIKQWIATNYILGINQVADITTLTAIIKGFDPTLLVTTASVSRNNVNFYPSIATPDVNYYFVIQVTNITVTNV